MICWNILGKCAEQHSGNNYMKEAHETNLVNPDFTPTVRPRTGQIIKPCKNCKNIFPNLYIMEYSETYIFSKDIDWFFKMNNPYIHVASAGGKLPATINDRENLRQIQYEVYNLPYIYSTEKIRINHGFIGQLLSPQLNDNPDSYDRYMESFINFARKGFNLM